MTVSQKQLRADAAGKRTRARNEALGLSQPRYNLALRDAGIEATKRRGAIQRFNNFDPPALALIRDRADFKPQWSGGYDESWLERYPTVCVENTHDLLRCYGVRYVWVQAAGKFFFQIAGITLDKERADKQGIAFVLEWGREHGYTIDEKTLIRHLHILSVSAPTMEEMAKVIDV